MALLGPGSSGLPPRLKAPRLRLLPKRHPSYCSHAPGRNTRAGHCVSHWLAGCDLRPSPGGLYFRHSIGIPPSFLARAVIAAGAQPKRGRYNSATGRLPSLPRSSCRPDQGPIAKQAQASRPWAGGPLCLASNKRPMQPATIITAFGRNPGLPLPSPSNVETERTMDTTMFLENLPGTG